MSTSLGYIKKARNIKWPELIVCIGFMDLSIDQFRLTSSVHGLPPVEGKPAFGGPLPCRRTASAFGEFISAAAHPRSRSARHAPLTAPPAPGYGMQRHQLHSKTTTTTSSTSTSSNSLSVARLYDWSPELAQERDESLSISRLYREIAGGVGASLPRFLTEKARARVGVGTVCNASLGTTQLVAASGGSVGARLNPGRMFLRDKGMLTKGEREIIEGIYRNRGDLQREAADSQSRAEFFVRSHHDAWLIGKPGVATNKPSTEIPREPPPRGGLLEVMAPTTTITTASPRDLAALSTSPLDAEDVVHQGPGISARPHCIMCWKEQQLLLQLQQQQQKQHSRQENSPRKDEGHQGRAGRHPFVKERGHKLHHHQHKQQRQQQQQHLPLPFNGVLRPVNINVNVVQAYRHHGEIEGAPAAPPTSPISKLPPALLTVPGLPGTNFSDSGLPSTSSTTTTANGLGRQPRKGHERVHALGVPDPQQTHLGEELHFLSDSDESLDRGPEGHAPVKGKADGGGKAKKVQVKVVLPQVASDPSEDAEAKSHGQSQPVDPLSTIVMQGRQALARSERHLSPSDLKDDISTQGPGAGGASGGQNKGPNLTLPPRLTPDNVPHRKSPSSTPSSSARTASTHRDDTSQNSHFLSELKDNNSTNSNNRNSTHLQHLQLKVHQKRPVPGEKENLERSARQKTDTAEADDSGRSDRRVVEDGSEEDGASKENAWDPSGHGARQFTSVRVPLRAHPVVITLVEGGDVKDS